MSSLTTITLDGTGTLIEPARPVGEIYSEVARDHGLRLSPILLQARFERQVTAMPPLAFGGRSESRRRQREREWWRRLVRRIVSKSDRRFEFDAFFDDLYGRFAAPACWRVYAEVPVVLRSLQAAGWRVAVVSNFDSRLPEILRGLQLEAFIDKVITPSRAGAAKPEPEIFREALAALGRCAAETVHVGDRRVEDWEGARAAGLSALLLDRSIVGSRAEQPDYSGLEPIRIDAVAESEPIRVGDLAAALDLLDVRCVA